LETRGILPFPKDMTHKFLDTSSFFLLYRATFESS
jgi:hypothetical protein